MTAAGEVGIVANSGSAAVSNGAGATSAGGGAATAATANGGSGTPAPSTGGTPSAYTPGGTGTGTGTGLSSGGIPYGTLFFRAQGRSANLMIAFDGGFSRPLLYRENGSGVEPTPLGEPEAGEEGPPQELQCLGERARESYWARRATCGRELRAVVCDAAL